MRSNVYRVLFVAGLSAFLFTSFPSAIQGADSEVRTFSVTVDGKSAGTYKMAIRNEDNGRETIAAVAAVKVKVGLFSYTYEHQCLEVWMGMRLTAVDSSTNDDGKKHTVKAVAAGSGLSVTVNGKERKGRSDVVSTTGWRYPGIVEKPRDVIVFDTEDGSETAAKIEALASVRLTVNGKAIEAHTFRLTGKEIDTLWMYDDAHRPVRQEMKWDGHKVVLELTEIAR